MESEIKEIAEKAALWLAVFFIVFSIELNLSVSQGPNEKSFSINAAGPDSQINIELNQEEIPVTTLIINLNNNLENIDLNILSTDFVNVRNPAEPYYRFFIISSSDLGVENIDSAKIGFAVDEDWIINNRLFASDIILQTYNSIIGWKKIDTVYEGFLNGYRVFSADVLSFDILQQMAITSRAQPVEIIAPTRTVELRRPEPIALPKPLDVQPQTQPTIRQLLTGSQFGKSELIFTFILVLVIFGIVSASRYIHSIKIRNELAQLKYDVEGISYPEESSESRLTKFELNPSAENNRKSNNKKIKMSKVSKAEKNSNTNPEKNNTKIKKEQFLTLKKFIQAEQAKGHKKEDISKALKNKRWPEDIVEKAFDELKTKIRPLQLFRIKKLQEKIIKGISQGKSKKELKEELMGSFKDADVNYAFAKVHELEDELKQRKLHAVHYDIAEAKKEIKELVKKGYTKKMVVDSLKLVGWPEDIARKL